MAHLSLSLLGPLQVARDGKPVTGFESDKVRALLAYLAVEAERPHPRGTLTGLLWPDWPERTARRNLTQALFNLRRTIGDQAAAPSFLLVSHESIQLNPASDGWVDVTAFTTLLATVEKHPHARLEACTTCLHHLQQAVALYRGRFLEGLTVGDSEAFEEWALLKREQLERQMLQALHRLTGCHEARGEYAQAGQYAWRQVELDPLHEPAHRQLMQVYAWGGRRSAALRQYRACARILEKELSVAPSVETTQLYEAIKTRRLPGLSVVVPSLPVAVEGREGGERGEAEVEQGVFVGRERELARLERFLEGALEGRGQVVFVAGEAGSGKTALLQAFARRAQEVHAGLVVVVGHCNAHTGLGDPYLPFREILNLLAGDVEARQTGGQLSRTQARHLQALMPATGRALVEDGPDLIDTFVSGAALVTRASGLAAGQAWQARLEERVARYGAGGGTNLEQARLFEQYARVVRRLATQQPLLLLVDDLQWADAGSISLLFHLGRQMGSSRMLLVGTYRPEDVALGRGGERHPLKPVANELKRMFGEIEVEGRRFVDTLLDSKPNRLDVAFRAALYRQTGGHQLKPAVAEPGQARRSAYNAGGYLWLVHGGV